jgi:hypothetical protein
MGDFLNHTLKLTKRDEDIFNFNNNGAVAPGDVKFHFAFTHDFLCCDFI